MQLHRNSIEHVDIYLKRAAIGSTAEALLIAGIGPSASVLLAIVVKEPRYRLTFVLVKYLNACQLIGT